jgi:hypothetical protein
VRLALEALLLHLRGEGGEKGQGEGLGRLMFRASATTAQSFACCSPGPRGPLPAPAARACAAPRARARRARAPARGSG